MKLALFALLMSLAVFASAQEPVKSPTPIGEEEPLKISTEEIHLNVRAQNGAGAFVSTLNASDLLLVEEGVPQEITSLKKTPASVMLLIDTGTQLNFAKRLNTTQLIAQIFVYSLPAGNSLSVMQYYDKIETLADWSDNYDAAKQALENKMFTGRQSRFSEALNTATEKFRTRPLENRHLVIITDGAETSADDAAVQQSLQNIRAANITLHVVSYTRLEDAQAMQAGKFIKLGDGKAKPRIDPVIYDDILRGMAMGKDGADAARLRARLRAINESQPIIVVNIDRERKKQIEKKRVIWKEAETTLQNLATETGGVFEAPEESENLFKSAAEIAKTVDAYYVLTYTPKSSLASSPGMSRKLRVSTYCEGVKIQSRERIHVAQ